MLKSDQDGIEINRNVGVAPFPVKLKSDQDGIEIFASSPFLHLFYLPLINISLLFIHTLKHKQRLYITLKEVLK